MNALPCLTTGPGTPELCAKAHAALLAAAAEKRPLKEVAAELGISRGTLRTWAGSHTNMRTWTVRLSRTGMRPLDVCSVTTPKGAVAAAVAAYREFPGTMKSLELPGWELLVDGQAFALEKIRAELALPRRAA